MKIYCDTNTLFTNVNEPAELAALKKLLVEHTEGRLVLYRSRADLREVMETESALQRQSLLADFEMLEPIPKDERVHGFQTQTDPYGGSVCNPLVSDVQDPQICRELEERGLGRLDAQHIVQAFCNDCDVFLTRDRKTIINPHRNWLEARFPKLKIRLPSELVEELGI